MFRVVVSWLSVFLGILAETMSLAQTADAVVPHPSLGSASRGAVVMSPIHQLGKFGESFVCENLRASGYEVYDANLHEHGIDLIAVKRDVTGAVKEVRLVEVKTRVLGHGLSAGHD